jgi:hypothetical protein
MNLQEMMKGRKVKQIDHDNFCILIRSFIEKGGT